MFLGFGLLGFEVCFWGLRFVVAVLLNDENALVGGLMIVAVVVMMMDMAMIMFVAV